MPFQEFSTVNSSEGFQAIFVYANSVTSGLFSQMILFSLFLVITIGGYLTQQRTTGRGDFAASFAMGGFITAGAAIIMSLIPGLVNLTTVTISFIIAVMGALWLFLDKASE